MLLTVHSIYFETRLASTCLFSDAKYFKQRTTEACVNFTQTQSHSPYPDLPPSPRPLRSLPAAAFVVTHIPSR